MDFCWFCFLDQSSSPGKFKLLIFLKIIIIIYLLSSVTQTVQKAGEHLYIYPSIHGIHISSLNISLIQEDCIACPDGSFSLLAVTNSSMLGSSEEYTVSCSTTVLRYYFY